jgi:hypothetical protein
MLPSAIMFEMCSIVRAIAKGAWSIWLLEDGTAETRCTDCCCKMDEPHQPECLTARARKVVAEMDKGEVQ